MKMLCAGKYGVLSPRVARMLLKPCNVDCLAVRGLILFVLMNCGISISSRKLCQNTRNEFVNQTVRYCPRIYVYPNTCSHKQRSNEVTKSTVKRVENLSLKDFLDNYDGKSPVIITDIVPNWTAFEKWTKEYFRQRYGDSRVAFKSVQGSLGSATGQMTDIKTFIDQIDKHPSVDSWIYLEDELFLIDKPQLRQHIGNNYILEENYFSLFPLEIQPWDCMMLWGSKFSRSSLHMDPYNWTAISAVLWGKKHWKLFPPGQDQYLYIQPHLKCGFPLECRKYDSPIDAFNPDYDRYPDHNKAKYIEVVQERGELLVIPSGWFHQAYNDEETLSISTQLMNRNNYQIILEEIVRGNNLIHESFLTQLSHLSPLEQVQAFLSQLPQKILEKGKIVTDRVMRNLEIYDNNVT